MVVVVSAQDVVRIVSTPSTHSQDYAREVTTRLLPLKGEIPDAKLSLCPICFAGPIWHNHVEFIEHLGGCVTLAAAGMPAQMPEST